MDDISPKSRTAAYRLSFLFIAIATAAIACAVLLKQSDVPREVALMAGIFVLAALLWVTEALPLFATSLLIVGLQLLLLANPGNWPNLGFELRPSPDFRAVLQAAFDPVLVLFFGGFLLARAAVKENVDKAMSSLLLRPFGSRPLWVLLGLMLVTMCFSMWMSNTATTAMMITLVAPMLAQMPVKNPFRKGLVLAVPFAANIGGMGTPIASPPNAVAVGFLQKSGQPLAFLDWMIIAVPLTLVMIFFTWILLWRMFHPRNAELRITLQPQALTGRGWYVVTVFAITALLWMTDRFHGLPASVVALLPAVALTATGILNRTDVNSLEWNILILIGGGIALGAGMQMTGLDQLIVQWLPISAGTNGFVFLGILVTATLLFGTFMSNTAAANLLLPIGISAVTAFGDGAIGIRQVAISIALIASLSMALPISTPPNAIAYGQGEISTRDMALTGTIIGIAGALLIVLLGKMFQG